jgi:transposase
MGHKGHTPKTFRDCDFGGRHCLIEIDHKRLECRHCYKTFTENLPFVRPYGHYTIRFENQVYECCKETTAAYTANKFAISEKAVMNIYRRFSEERQKTESQEKPTEIIGFDEISMHKGHKDFILIITDISNKRVLDVLPDRKKETLEAYLKTWTKERLKGIKAVAIDLWGPYRSVAEEFFPQADIVADRFHVMQNLNRCLDTCRKEEKQAYDEKKSLLEEKQNMHY